MNRIIKTRLLLILAIVLFAVVCAFCALTIKGAQKVRADFTPTLDFQIEKGASVRVVSETESGLRYKTYVSKAYYQTLEGKNPQTGSIIIPKAYVEKVKTDNGGNFTLSALLALVENNELPFAYKDSSAISEAVENYYTYALTMVDIKETNYATDFMGIAYIRVDSATEGFEHVTGSVMPGGYYKIATEDNAASVYSVSKKAMQSDVTLTSQQQTVIKTYLDGVADLTGVDGIVTIANNVDGKYTSPYTLSVANGNYLINSTVGDAKNVIYNGIKQTSFPITDGDITVNLPKTQNITYNGTNMTLQGAIPTNMVSGATLTSLDGSEGDLPKNLGYYALNGNYGIGTYIDISFSGKNIPSVMFFADKINGNLGNNGGQGLLILNGANSKVTTDNKSINFGDKVKVVGPNRVPVDTSVADAGYLRVSSNFAYTSYTAKHVDNLEKFAYANLVDGNNYRYIIGTFEKEGNVWLEMGLYNSGLLVEHITFDTTLTTSAVSAGSIIAYATLKKDSNNNPVDTTFTFNGILNTYPEIAVMRVSSDAVVNADGSITINDLGALTNAYIGSVRAKESGYVAFEGDYGTGTYVEFEFTGNNMPQLCFFADEINGWITCGNDNGINPSTGKNQGFMILNGIVANTTTEECFTDRVMAYGMYRMYYGTSAHSMTLINQNIYDNPENENQKVAGLLSQDALIANPAASYRMVIGTHADAEGVLYLDIYLFNASTNERLLAAEINVAKPLYTVQTGSEPSGHIIAMATIKNGGTTTFKVTQGPGTIDRFDIVGATTLP